MTSISWIISWISTILMNWHMAFPKQNTCNCGSLDQLALTRSLMDSCLNSVLSRQTPLNVAYKPGLDYLWECFLSSIFIRIIGVLPEKCKTFVRLGPCRHPPPLPSPQPVRLWLTVAKNRICRLKFEKSQIFHATFVDVTCCCGRLARFVQQCWARACVLACFSTHNMPQHVAAWWPNACNMLRPTLLRYVA